MEIAQQLESVFALQPEMQLKIKQGQCKFAGIFHPEKNIIRLYLPEIYRRAKKEKIDFAERLCRVINHEYVHYFFAEEGIDYQYTEEFIACFFAFEKKHKYIKKLKHMAFSAWLNLDQLNRKPISDTLIFVEEKGLYKYSWHFKLRLDK